MIIVTGAAGFIGSNFVSKLNEEGFRDIVVVDDFSNQQKNNNLKDKKYSKKINRDIFFEWAHENEKFIQIIVHIGARTDTAEFNKSVFDKLNLDYSKEIWNICVKYGIPLIYASSAATYGNGEMGYSDNHDIIEKLKPLNPYGESKNEFDKWALKQERKPYFWAGFKFFNVYGPNEYHKGRMASVIFHTYNQIRQTGQMKLFKSHNSDFKDGEQLRDFIYVKDVVNTLFAFLEKRGPSGIFNLGTGKARTFYDLVSNTFEALGLPVNIKFIDMPEDIRDKYQYYTQADMQKVKSLDFNTKFHSLEQGVSDYVKNYLIHNRYN